MEVTSRLLSIDWFSLDACNDDIVDKRQTLRRQLQFSEKRVLPSLTDISLERLVFRLEYIVWTLWTNITIPQSVGISKWITPQSRQYLVFQLWESVRCRIGAILEKYLIRKQVEEERRFQDSTQSVPLPDPSESVSMDFDKTGEEKTIIMEKVSLSVHALNQKLLEKRNILSVKLTELVELREEVKRLRDDRERCNQKHTDEFFDLVTKRHQLRTDILCAKSAREKLILRLKEIETMRNLLCDPNDVIIPPINLSELADAFQKVSQFIS
jgi:hypothetical protein